MYLTVELEDKIPKQKEIKVAIKIHKNNKAPEKDSIMAELLKKLWTKVNAGNMERNKRRMDNIFRNALLDLLKF